MEIKETTINNNPAPRQDRGFLNTKRQNTDNKKVLFEIGNGTITPVETNKSNEKRRNFRPNNYKRPIRNEEANNTNNSVSVFDNTPSPELIAKNTTTNPKALKVVFIGGVGEIGKNMTALEYGNDIVVIDSGLTFPSKELFGVDLVIPDFTYLKINKNKIRGIVLTHGHEDHIGALPYVLSDISTTIYGSRMTIALVDMKMSEHKKVKYKSEVVKAGQSIRLGCFNVEFINVNHSIAGAMALAISTPVGMVVHTGDFKIDYTPISGETTDLTRFGEIGKKGVQLLLCESTNVEKQGFSMSEKTVGATLDKLFNENKDYRLIIATFASNIYRLQQVLDLAVKYGRKIVFTGRSMVNISETAMKIGELRFDKGNIVDIDKMKNYKPSEICVLTTGSQGEPMSALTRMANGEFPKLQLCDKDCIIMSASPIPGNEESVFNVINNLYYKGAKVIYHELADVHVSGHACQQELKTIHSLVKPKYFIPVHGEYRHLKLHYDLAVDMGIEPRNAIIAELGDVIEVTQTSIKKGKSVTSGCRLVDGLGLGDIDSTVLRDRKAMSIDGVCAVIVHIGSNGFLTRAPELVTKGLIYTSEKNDILQYAKDQIYDKLRDFCFNNIDANECRNAVRRAVTNVFKKLIERTPVILTILNRN